MASIKHLIVDSWEDVDLVEKPKPQKKKFAELECYPKLRKILLKKTKVEVQETLQTYLEAIVVWKPKLASVGKREIANKQKELDEYQCLYQGWLRLIETLGLKENSTLTERLVVQNVLEKYADEKFVPVKFEFHPCKNAFGIV